MMATTSYKIRLRYSAHSQKWPSHPLTRLTMPHSSQFSDIPSTCRRNHCTSRPSPCVQRSCRAALASRLDRRELTITTKKNVLNPVLSNIYLIIQDIRNKCDRSALRSKEITQAYSRYSDCMNRAAPRSRCSCQTCAIERADRKIELLAMQYLEAKRWLDALKKYRWKHDLDASSTTGSVGR